MHAELLEKFKKSWPSPIVARSDVAVFSGGLLNARTMANKDSLGEGPPKITFGCRQVAYERDALLEWMRQRWSKKEGVA